VKKIEHDKSKAKMGEFDVAVHSLLRMVGGHIDGKKPDDMDDAVRFVSSRLFYQQMPTPSTYLDLSVHD
jgi:hypothetical protein